MQLMLLVLLLQALLLYPYLPIMRLFALLLLDALSEVQEEYPDTLVPEYLAAVPFHL